MKIKQLFFSLSNNLQPPLLIIAMLVSSSVSATHSLPNPVNLETISISINHGNDDVEEKAKKGTIYFNSTDLELIKDKYNKQNKQTVGLRFNNINIPQGSTVTNAYIEFTVDETDSKSLSLDIYGQAIDNAPPFTSSKKNVSSRSRTYAKVKWKPGAWRAVGLKKKTPELLNIVQEIVDRSGWEENNSMVFMVRGKSKQKRVAESYEGSAKNAAKLVIVYESAIIEPPVSALPLIELNAALIVDEPKNPGTFQLISNRFLQDTGVLDMGIETRGSTSQEFEKKSFSIELVEADDPSDEFKLTLLDLRKDGDWILDASYRDASFVRNIVGHDIYNDMRPYAFIDENGEQKGQATIRGYLSEITLNDQYQGVYVLEEKVDRKLLGLKKLNIPEDENDNELFDQIDFSDPENGTVLYKADSNDATLGNLATARIDFEQKYPKISDIAHWEPLEDLIQFVNFASDSEFINTIGERVEIDSVVDYWILMHIISDADSFKKNYYLARSGAGKFFFVPWDNDASFGMAWDGAREDGSIYYFQSTLNENA